MRENSTTDELLKDRPAADIDAVVVDPADIVETFRRNYEEENQLNTHVLRVLPPFDGVVRAEPYLQEGRKRYRDRDPEPLHLTPGTFLENADGAHPGETHLTFPTREDATDESYEAAIESFEARARDALLDRIRIYFEPSNGTEIWVDARYESREE